MPARAAEDPVGAVTGRRPGEWIVVGFSAFFRLEIRCRHEFEIQRLLAVARLWCSLLLPLPMLPFVSDAGFRCVATTLELCPGPLWLFLSIMLATQISRASSEEGCSFAGKERSPYPPVPMSTLPTASSPEKDPRSPVLYDPTNPPLWPFFPPRWWVILVLLANPPGAMQQPLPPPAPLPRALARFSVGRM